MPEPSVSASAAAAESELPPGPNEAHRANAADNPADNPAENRAAEAEQSTPAAEPAAPSRGRDGLARDEREHIRGWALDQGIEVKPRGQLKKDLISSYQAWDKRVNH